MESKIQQMAYGTANDMACLVARETKASDSEVSITVKSTDDSLWFVISTTRNGKLEETRLMCSATSLERLTAHAAGFIANVSN